MVCIVASVAAVRGQTVIGGAAGGDSSSNAAIAFAGSGARPAVALSSIASALAQTGPLAQVGPIAVRPHASYEIISGTGILRIPGKPEETTRHTVSGGVLLEAGTRASADYTLSRVMYSNGGLSDATNHNARAQGSLTLDDLKFGISGSYGDNTNVLVETGGQTREETYTASGIIAYQLGRRTELELNFGVNDRSANPIAGTVGWTGNDLTLWTASSWLRRHISQDLSVAAGYAVGYDEVAQSPDMTYGQPQVQVKWKPTKKISVEAEYGWERRKTKSTRARTDENSRYSGSLNYSPFPTTTLSAGVSRSINPSYFAGQTTLSDGWNAGLRQRLLTRLFLSAGLSQTQSDYKSVLAGGAPGRGERYSSHYARLSTPVFQKGSVAVFYQHGRNRSSQAIYNFTSNQVGAEIAYRF